MATSPNPDGIGNESKLDDIVDNFDNMNLNPELLRGIYAYGLERPTAIQQRALLPILKKQDVIAQAPPGGGKTVAFSISILQGIDTSINQCQALVLAPTRERTPQIQKIVLALGDFMKIRCHVCIGGTHIRNDIECLREGPQVVIGTPGRVLNMIRRGALKTDFIKMFIMDEADEILSIFKDQLYDVFQQIPRSAQVVLFSPTISTETREMSSKFMREPIRITVTMDDTIPSVRDHRVS